MDRVEENLRDIRVEMIVSINHADQEEAHLHGLIVEGLNRIEELEEQIKLLEVEISKISGRP